MPIKAVSGINNRRELDHGTRTGIGTDGTVWDWFGSDPMHTDWHRHWDWDKRRGQATTSGHPVVTENNIPHSYVRAQARCEFANTNTHTHTFFGFVYRQAGLETSRG